MSCKNHPSVTARRKCFFCKSLICPECQIKRHHHVFCSDACIQAFENGSETQSISNKFFNQLDQSLSEDFKEYGQSIIDHLEKSFHDKTSLYHKTVEEKQAYLEDQLQQLRQQVLSQRTFIQQWFDQRSQDIEKLQRWLPLTTKRTKRSMAKVEKKIESQIRRFDDTSASLTKLLGDESRSFNDRLEELSGSVSDKLEKLSSSSSDQLRDLTHVFSDKMKRLEEETETRMKRFKSDLDASFEKHTRNLLDDISTLMSAQKGNWHDILEAATKGSKEAGMFLRDHLRHELQKQIIEIAKTESESFKKISQEAKTLLISKIQSQLSPWPRRASIAAVTLSIMTLILIPVGFMSLQHTQQSQWSAWIQSQKHALTHAKSDAPTRSGETLKATKQALPTISSIDRGSLMRKELTFTFDGGSNSKAAETILDILKKYRIRSTMFLTGQFIENSPEVVKRIVAEGHEAGNHLYRHEHLVQSDSETSHYSKEQLLKELQDVERIFEKVTGKDMTRFWRAPFGEVTQEQIEWAKTKGYVHVGWTKNKRQNLDTHDWVADSKSKLFKTPDQIAQKILGFEKNDPNGLNGAIILMHLGSERQPKHMAHLALPNLLEQLSDKGYRVVPISDILRTELAQNN